MVAVAEPRVERIVTGNVAVNPHHAINEQLGYELARAAGQSYEIAVVDLCAAPAVNDGPPWKASAR